MTKRSKPSTHTQVRNFWFQCPHCDYQFLTKGNNNEKLCRKITFNHLRKTHKYTDEDVKNFIGKNSKKQHGKFLERGFTTNLNTFSNPDYK